MSLIRHTPRPTPNHVNKAEFARRNNYTPGQVKAQYKADKLVHDGMWVLEKESLQRIAERQAARAQADTMRKQAMQPNAPAGGDYAKLFAEARARKEHALAIKAEIENLERSKELVEMAQVEKMMAGRSRAFRDGLMGAAKRLAPIAAGMKDVRAIEKEMETEFRYILEQWTQEPLI